MSTPATGSISITIAAPSGDSTTYWRVTDIEIKPKTMTMNVELSGYLSVAAEQSSDSPLDTREVSLSGAALAGVVSGGSALLVALANWIVANVPDFSGGTVN